MKTNTAARTADVQVPGEVRKATIANSPAMFNILYDRLYEHKELAIVRELLTNAWDAHCRAGTQATPIDIHLPTPIEPWYAIRDYGIGLSPDAIETLYMDYGRSDKNHANDEIGGFGLGSKSPYCYTDQFTVISHKDRERHVYTAFLQSDGTPACTHWATTDTVEPNGLEVQVNVVSHDAHHRFGHALAKLIPFVPTCPSVNVDLPSGLSDALADAAGGDLCTGARHVSYVPAPHGSRRPAVTFIQGIVPYTFTLQNQNHGLNRDLIALLEHFELYIWVDVGTLEVTASRESLSLDEATKQRAIDMTTKTIQNLQNQIALDLQNAPNWYEFSKIGSPLPSACIRRCVPNAELAIDLNEKLPGLSAYRYDRKLKANYRKIDSYLRYNALELDKTVIYIRPGPSHPIRAFLEQLFNDNDSPEHALIVTTDDPDAVRHTLTKLGIPNKVREMPKIRRARQPRSYGAQKYPYQLLDSSGFLANLRRDSMTDILNGYVRLVLCPYSHLSECIRSGIESGYLTLAPDYRILFIDIPDTHTRVWANLKNDMPVINDLDGLLQLNHRMYQNRVNAEHAFQYLTDQGQRNLIGSTMVSFDPGRSLLHDYMTVNHEISRMCEVPLPNGVSWKRPNLLLDRLHIHFEVEPAFQRKLDALLAARDTIASRARDRYQELGEIIYHHSFRMADNRLFEELARYLPAEEEDPLCGTF